MAKGNHSHFGENMRNVHFKSRTFILIGFALMGFAAFSYWGLSTQNTDLLVKIEQLEDNVKMGTRKQRDLEDELQVLLKKSTDLQKANVKLQSELQQKENLISAQGVEGSQWRDKVRNAEAEVEKFKTVLADKTKQLQDAQKQISTYMQDMSLKDTKLSEAQQLIQKLKTLQSGSSSGNNETAVDTKVSNQTSTRPPVPAADSNLVLAKPNADEDDDKKHEKHQEEESVVARPMEENAVKPEEELELVDPNRENPVERAMENDETKFKEIHEEMEIGDVEKVANAQGPNSKEANENNNNNVINEPNLINSQADNAMDDEPALVDTNPRFRNFKARVMHKKEADEDNLPEDQEIENEHDDDRGDN